MRQPGGAAQVDGAYLVDGDRHADTTILIDHQADHCASRQTQKGVIDDDGRAVYQGKILVRPQAQKTDGYQLSQTLLLSPKAEADVKPELEIHADDVKCSHGATVGRLDADALFFLRARGIPEAEARALLIQGFIGGALDEIDRPEVRDAFGVAGVQLVGRAFGEQSMTLQRSIRSIGRAVPTGTTSSGSARIFQSCRDWCTANRWFISTARRRRKNRAR